MKRFIAHHELARDSRFVRQDNIAATVHKSQLGIGRVSTGVRTVHCICLTEPANDLERS